MKKPKSVIPKAQQNQKTKTVIFLLVLIVIPFFLYMRTLDYGFTDFDDNVIISNVHASGNGSFDLKAAFTHDAFMNAKAGAFYRPFQTISFMIDHAIGGEQPQIYHLTNIILHILTVIALYLFLCNLGVKREHSFLLALIFSVHPMMTHAVAWIPARGDLLLCLFSILSFLTYKLYFESPKAWILVLHAVCFVLAVFSKETFLLLPLLIAAYHFFVAKRQVNPKDAISFSVIWLLSIGLFFYLRAGVVSGNSNANNFGLIPFIKNLQTIPDTIAKLLLPLGLTTMPFFELWATITGLVCLTAVIYGIVKLSKQNNRLAAWGLVWFFAFTIPPMFFRAHIIGIGFEYFEYRSYMPFIGILLILGILAARLPHGFTFPKLLKIVIPIALLYAVIAYAHTSDFAAPMSFYSAAVKANPQNAFALSERGSAFLKENNLDKAIADFDSAIKIEPEFSTPYYNKGAMYSYTQDHPKAEYYFSLALKYDTLHTESHNPAETSFFNLSMEKLSLKKYDEVLAVCSRALQKYPAYSGFYNNIAQVYEVQGKHDDAIAMYSKAIHYDSANAEYFSNRGVAKYHLNNNTEAIRDFNRALEVNPDYADALVNRAVVKLITQDNDGAYMDLSNAAVRKPKMAIIYYYRGVALMNLKKPDAARADWQKAAELGNLKAAEILAQSSQRAM